MRLDKYLAHAGVGTRKQVKILIRKKHIRVNGVICNKDDAKINEFEDKVCIDGEDIQYQSVVYLMLNKPKGVVSATKDNVYPTVFDCIDAHLPKGCFPVGRLDVDTEGLVIICNNGKLAHDILSPKKHVDKVYEVETSKKITQTAVKQLEEGSILLDGILLKPAHVERLDDTHMRLTICEGKFHQVKRMFLATDNEVVYLKRIRIGNLALDDTLQVGEWRYLHDEEIEGLLHG